MKTFVENGPAYSPFPGIEVATLAPGLPATAFHEFVSGLVIPEHISLSGDIFPSRPVVPMGGVREMRRTPEMPRDPWAPDHFWHFDWGTSDQDPFATAIYAHALKGVVAATEFIDMSRFLQMVEHDNPGISDELSEATTVLSYLGKYYREVLPAHGSAEAQAKALRAHDATSLEAIADKADKDFPRKEYPTIAPHPLRAESESYLVIDEARAEKINGVDSASSKALLKKLLGYLSLPSGALQEAQCFYGHEWEPGHVVVMSRAGTLHRALPSPEGEENRHTMRLFMK